jgi:hypothetical protein
MNHDGAHQDISQSYQLGVDRDDNNGYQDEELQGNHYQQSSMFDEKLVLENRELDLGNTYDTNNLNLEGDYNILPELYGTDASAYD